MNDFSLMFKHWLLIIKMLICAEVLYSSSQARECQNYKTIPYGKQIKQIRLPKEQKESLEKMWATLYAAYHAHLHDKTDYDTDFKNLKTGKTPAASSALCTDSVLRKDAKELQRLEFCLDKTTKPVNDTNCMTNLQAAYSFLTPVMFGQVYEQLQHRLSQVVVKDDKIGVLSKYATYHLYRAAQRLSSISSIKVLNNEPKIIRKGDVRDFGVLVNIQNNSSSEFEIHQRSVDGKNTTLIGMLEHGMNTPNLHTASLQASNAKQDLTNLSTQTEHYFELIPTNGEINKAIAIRFYTGADLVNLLKTLPRKDPNIFEMNGLPTSPQHLTEPNDWYLVITQSLTPSTQAERNPDQRIQAINVSKLEGPYLLTMQINEAPIPHNEPDRKVAQGAVVVPSGIYANGSPVPKMFQPSFVTAQVIQKPAKDVDALPLLIMPQYLWAMPELQTSWMQLTTLYCAAATDFAFFGNKTYGSAFEYYKGLGYFSVDYEYRFIIDGYNMLPIGNKFDDVFWLIASSLYETSLKTISDLPLLHSTQNLKNTIVANGIDAFYINFQIGLNKIKQSQPSIDIYNMNGFNGVYNMTCHQLCTLLFSIEKNILKEEVFVDIMKVGNDLYSIKITNKQNIILFEKHLGFNAIVSFINVAFLNNRSEWVGSTVPQNLISKQLAKKTNGLNFVVSFKVILESGKFGDKHLLLATESTPIDKMDMIHTVTFQDTFSKNPLIDLYYDVYKMFKVEPYTRCYVFKNGILPKFLANLQDQDWKNGIYLIAQVENNNQITEKTPGALTVLFYSSDKKTIIGKMKIKGRFNNDPLQRGIREAVKAYSLYSKNFNPMMNIFFSTGVCLKFG